MNEEDLLAPLCAGLLVLAVLAVLAFIILGMRPYTYRKRTEKGTNSLTVTAKTTLAKVIVVARFGKEEIRFERKRVRKGQSVEFVYPASKRKAKLIVEVESGNVQVAEV